jgi:hypothetical protein
MSEANGDTNRLAILKKRAADLQQAISEEKVRQAKRREKDRARLAAIVGEAVLQEAARVRDFELLLKQTLKKAVNDEKAVKFLVEMQWL